MRKIGGDDGADANLEALELPPEFAGEVRRVVEAMRTPLRPGDPRRHHFIPQFFLRRFAEGDQLALVRLGGNHKPVIANVGDVAVIKDFYTTIDVDVGETVAVERLLANVDAGAVRPIERLAGGVLFPPQRRDRMALALWLGILQVRGPEFRRQMEAITDFGLKLQLSTVRDEESAKSFLGGGNDVEPEVVRSVLDTVGDLDSFEFGPHQNEMIRTMLEMSTRLAAIVLNLLFAIVRFPEPGLVLSDRPLVLYRHPENRSPLRGVGFATADEIWIPLDRRTALIMHRDPGVGEVVIDAPPDHSVDDFNQAVVSHAFQEVYCHPDDVGRLTAFELSTAGRPLAVVNGASWMTATTDGVNAPPTRPSPRRYRRSASEAG